jgi:hypothetical protein
VNKKLLMLTLIPLVLSVIVTPGMAIGPQKAEKNPNIIITPETIGVTAGAAELILPSGGDHSWMADTSEMAIDFMNILDASKAKIPNEYTLDVMVLMDLMTNPILALEYENKWGYMSYAVLLAVSVMEDPTQVVYASGIAVATAGQAVVTVADASGFSDGDEVLISDSLWMVQEVGIIASVDTGNNELTLESSLQNTYASGTVFVPSETLLDSLSMWREGIYVKFVNVGPTWDA